MPGIGMKKKEDRGEKVLIKSMERDKKQQPPNARPQKE